MSKRNDDCYFRDCEHLKVVWHNGDPHDWDWACKKYRVYLRQEKQDVLRCRKCQEEAVNEKD
jgi:hypothetical protein